MQNSSASAQEETPYEMRLKRLAEARPCRAMKAKVIDFQEQQEILESCLAPSRGNLLMVSS